MAKPTPCSAVSSWWFGVRIWWRVGRQGIRLPWT